MGIGFGEVFVYHPLMFGCIGRSSRDKSSTIWTVFPPIPYRIGYELARTGLKGMFAVERVYRDTISPFYRCYNLLDRV